MGLLNCFQLTTLSLGVFNCFQLINLTKGLLNCFQLTTLTMELELFPANYLDNWKCIAVLKGDGSNGGGDRSQQASGSYGSSGGTSNGSTNTRYLKLGPVTLPSQVVWH